MLQTAVLVPFALQTANLNRAIYTEHRDGYVQHGEGMSQRNSSPSLQLWFPESISLLFMNWQELDPMNPLVISCGGPGSPELMDSQLGSPVTPKTQHT